MKISDNILQKYADLIVRKGANVQPGQVVRIRIAVDQHDLAALLTESCYKAGAKIVYVDWESDRLKHLNYQYAEADVLGTLLPWEYAKLEQMTEDLPCMIYILSEDPDAMAGLDPQKLSGVLQKRALASKPYNDRMNGKYQWVIAAAASPAWAMKCFPEDTEEAAMEKLWDAILTTVHVSEDNDPIADWDARTGFMDQKSAWLNEQRFRYLRYSSANGTDFTVELLPDANWEGAVTVNEPNGVSYIANMPTEEIFTSPRAGSCDGTLVATKPLSWNSSLIDGFSITFKDGRAVSCKAETGQELLEYMLQMDEGASMIGEVALVPKESPVNRCGFLFYNTLFDENACCHVALGRGFTEVLPDGNSLTTEEARLRGINDSIIHVDFMVGSEDLAIDGILEDGTAVPVFRNGTWA